MISVVTRSLGVLGSLALLSGPAFAQSPGSAPFECDGGYDEDCGTPNMSGGGGGGGGGAILINNTDVGDSYQHSDDFDSDGVDDTVDTCPFTPNIDQSDSDGDGIGDACDNCLAAANPDQFNLDGDLLGDVCDADLDGDDVPNDIDNCQFVPNRIAADATAQADMDGDKIGDACDPDIDGDSLDNLSDLCPMDPDVNASGESCFVDTDGDGFGDFTELGQDLCPTLYDTTNLDLDGDKIGDACDPDMDGDGIANQIDNCQGIKNAGQVDLDRDGQGDACDDRFCFVVFGDEDKCLDPAGALTVYSPPINANTGDAVRLRLFANRQNQPMSYTWSVISAPAGSRALLENPSGMVSYSTPFEYRYLADKVSMLKPDVAGEYVISVSATTIWEDRVTSKMNSTATTTVTIKVEGDTVEVSQDDDAALADAGCNAGGSTGGLGFAVLMLIGLALVRRRRELV